MPFEALTSLFATSVYAGVIVRCFRARALTAPGAQFFTNSSIMYRLWADSSISWSQETRGVVTAVGRNLDGTGGVDGPRGVRRKRAFGVARRRSGRRGMWG